MTKLSPAAQAVLAAYDNSPFDDDIGDRVAIAAALRAAAEVVAPISYEDVWTDGKWLQYEKQDEVRYKLLSITDELERAND